MPPSLLLVGNFLSASLGTRTVCEDLAMRLAACGWRVQTTSAKPGRIPRAVDMVVTAWSRRRTYDVAQVDVYSGAAFVWAEAVCRVLRAAGKPFVLTLHGGNLPRFASRWPGRVRRLLRSATVVTTPSRYLLEHLTPLRRDLRLVPNALDLGAYTYRLRERPVPRLVWLRSFHHLYDPVLAPAVLARLVPHHPDIRLTMVGGDRGDGSLQATRAEAVRLGVAERVTFTGGVPKADVPQYLNASDIFLNTTTADNAPVSVLEAMACGLCVVSTNVGGIPYLVTDGVDGLLVPPGDPDAMAATVHRVLTEPELARGLSHEARRTAQRFDWSVILAEWQTLLTEAARGRDP
jgi:glycosyltransferase involved in cell wall biosynthesis